MCQVPFWGLGISNFYIVFSERQKRILVFELEKLRRQSKHGKSVGKSNGKSSGKSQKMGKTIGKSQKSDTFSEFCLSRSIKQNKESATFSEKKPAPQNKAKGHRSYEQKRKIYKLRRRKHIEKFFEEIRSFYLEGFQKLQELTHEYMDEHEEYCLDFYKIVERSKIVSMNLIEQTKQRVMQELSRIIEELLDESRNRFDKLLSLPKGEFWFELLLLIAMLNEKLVEKLEKDVEKELDSLEKRIQKEMENMMKSILQLEGLQGEELQKVYQEELERARRNFRA